MPAGNIFSLKGRVSVVTGGLGLLGLAITRALAISGAKVIVLDLNRKKWEETSAGFDEENLEVFYENCDITKLGQIKAKIKRLEKKYGSIDIWINCAYPHTKDWGDKLERVTSKSWRENIEMQLNSCCISSNEIAMRMAARKRGSIINIASIYGVVSPDFSIYKDTRMTTPAAYSAIKGGIIAYSKYLAGYFGKDGIRINVVCPGGIHNKQPEKFVKRYSEKTLLGRMAGPYEIAWPVVFLASDAAAYVTGAVLIIDGGLTTT